MDVFKKELGYYAWIMRGDFSQTRNVVSQKSGKLKK